METIELIWAMRNFFPPPAEARASLLSKCAAPRPSAALSCTLRSRRCRQLRARNLVCHRGV
eukprot:763600-Hanusia_phi.AAC.9